VVRWPTGPGAPGPSVRPTGWLAVRVRQPAWRTNARPVFRSLRILYLGEASRGGTVYRGLDSGACTGDGLDGTEAAAGGDRAREVAQALPAGAGEKERYQHRVSGMMFGCRARSKPRYRVRLR